MATLVAYYSADVTRCEQLSASKITKDSTFYMGVRRSKLQQGDMVSQLLSAQNYQNYEGL
jgi:hypothetical protein